MDEKVLTVEEKLRALAEEAAEASEKSFAALRELLRWANRLEQLWIEEWRFTAVLKGKNQWRSPESRIFTRRRRSVQQYQKRGSAEHTTFRLTRWRRTQKQHVKKCWR